MWDDTIAAIATGLSDAGIGIVRLSGKKAIDVADRVFRTPDGNRRLKEYKSHTIHYGYVVDGEDIIDEVMVSLMKRPKSYTKEDTVEISCHGGVFLLKKVLEMVLKNGARLAEPGEFTKRAFLNGRIDLTEAEAVMDLIRSQNEFARKTSLQQLKGSVSDEVKDLRAQILYETAFIESALDDPEHISLEGYPERLSGVLEQLMQRLQKLLESADDGRMRKEGIQTVIVGKPNAGKSSLLNLLAGEERAIVTAVAGTTRDALQESVRLKDISLHLVDTAGIRSTEDMIERIGVDRAKKYAKDADLIVYVVDSSVPLDENDRQIADVIREKNTIVLLNKTDLPPAVTEGSFRTFFRQSSLRGEEEFLRRSAAPEETEGPALRVIKTSTKERKGMEEFARAVEEMFFSGTIRSENEVIITSLRHKKELEEAYESLQLAMESVNAGMPEDFYSIDLMNAYAALGRVTGEEAGEDLIEEIFSKFCMGK